MEIPSLDEVGPFGDAKKILPDLRFSEADTNITYPEKMSGNEFGLGWGKHHHREFSGNRFSENCPQILASTCLIGVMITPQNS